MADPIPSIESLVKEARKIYKEEFNSEPENAVCAPGRVNLIGEHTDYNDGFVLPMALPLVTVVVGSKITGDQSVVITTNKDADLPHKVTIEMPSKHALIRACLPGTPKWANYIKGVISKYNGETPAFQAVIVSSVPLGGGLSSSASIEVATYTFLETISGPNNISLTDKALACQKAEHDYAGMPCGIMDQFISIMGKKDHCLLIDCRTMATTLIPLADPSMVILITNSNIKHELTGSEYSTRRKQCQQAALLLKKLSLRDATHEDIDYLQSINTDTETIKRARHVVNEIQRTKLGAEALKERNYNKFGELMVQSHTSLRDDFEVSCPELDSLVHIAIQCEGVLGSRMTGGGFGGCTVTMVQNYAIQKVIQTIKAEYNGKATFYVCHPCEGAQVLKL